LPLHPPSPPIPTAFSYQGTLRLADGSLATGSYNITLNIYNVVTSGTALHTESFSNVVVRNGNFSVVVGNATPVAATVFDNANLYIGITVAPDPEMLPRQRLFPVPWAMQASQANSATVATTATTLVKDATINGLIINKGATNEGALKLTSSGPGWGSGMRFENTAANRTYGIYVGTDGIWRFADDTAAASRIYIQPNGAVRVIGLVSDTDFFSYGGIRTLQNLQVEGSASVGGNMSANGKVYAAQGFNGYCRGSGPIDVRCNKTVVAMIGRVPTKFSLENGPIGVGDPLTSSSQPGVAMKATKAGQIIGYAMQSSDAAKDGKLLVWLQLGTYIPQATLDALNNAAPANSSAADPSISELKAQLAELAAQVAKLQAAK